MNIQQLKYVKEVANHGSFREAAKKMFVTQPSLSNGIKDLEKQLGVQLFTRTNRGAVLTLEGQDFLQYAEKILLQVDHLESRYQTNRKTDFFSIASQHYDFLGPLISQLIQETSEDIQCFRIMETTTGQVINEVKEHHSELGILYRNEKNAEGINRYLEQAELQVQVIGQFQTHIFLSYSHPLANREVLTLEELAGYPQVRFTQDGTDFSYFFEDLVESPEQESVIYVSDRGTLMNILLETKAYASGSGIVIGGIREQVRLIPLCLINRSTTC